MAKVNNMEITKEAIDSDDGKTREFNVISKYGKNPVNIKDENGKNRHVLEIRQLWLNDDEIEDLKTLLNK